MSLGFNISDTSVSNLAKRKYVEKSLNMYNGLIASLGLIKKTYDNVGERCERYVPTGYCGGASFGSLGEANRGVYEKAYFTTKKVYVRGEIDRRTIKQFKDAGAFVDGIKETMKKIVEKFNWVMNYALMGPGDGSFGTIESVSASGAVYTCVITAATWVKARWEVREHVNIGTNTDRFEITAVTRSTRSIAFTRRTGSYVPQVSDVVYLEGGYGGTAPEGAIGVLSAAASTKYGITIADRWQAYQVAAASAGISPDLMNQVNLGVYDQVGIAPTHVFGSVVQLQKLMNSMEDQKRYSLSPTKLAPRAENLVGKVSFSGVELMGPAGTIPFLVDRFVPDSTLLFMNMDECEIAHSDQGWFDDDGTIFLRKADEDAYECRYGGYLEIYIPPTVNGYLSGLSTAV